MVCVQQHCNKTVKRWGGGVGRQVGYQVWNPAHVWQIKGPVRAAQPCVIRAAILPLIRNDWPRLCLINRTTQTPTHRVRLSLTHTQAHTQIHTSSPRWSGSDWKVLDDQDYNIIGLLFWCAECWQFPRTGWHSWRDSETNNSAETCDWFNAVYRVKIPTTVNLTPLDLWLLLRLH